MPVCTTALCQDGRAAVAQMWTTLGYLKANYPNFNAAYYEPTCNAIQAEKDAVDSWYAALIPFNPVCCTIDDIGKEAEGLTNEMLASVGASGVPVPPPPPEDNWITGLVVVGVIALAIVYSPQLKRAIG